MEVDLTDDDVIITTSASSNAPVPTSRNEKEGPSVETVDITDDDDVVFDTGKKVTPKTVGLQSKVTSKEKVPKAIDPPISQTKSVVEKGKIEIDDDEVIEVVESSHSTAKSFQQKTSQNVVFEKPYDLSASKSKSQAADNRMDTDDVIEVRQPELGTDDVIEVMEPLHSVPAGEKSNTSQKKPSALDNCSVLPTQTVPSNTITNNPAKTDDVPQILKPSRSRSIENSPPGGDLPLAVRNVEFEKNSNNKPNDQAKKSRLVPDSRFVVDITDEKETHQKRKSENKCLNVHCEFGEELTIAPMFVVSYYGCKLKKGRHEVCAACVDVAIKHHEDLANRLVAQKPLLSYEYFPLNDIPIVDLESDEETSETEDPLPLSLLQDVEKNLEEVLKDSISKYNLDYQLKEATGILTEKMTALELSARKIDDIYDQVQREIDEMRCDVYKSHEPIRKEQPSLDIIPDIPYQFKPPSGSLPLPPAGQQLRPQLRGVAMKKVTQMSPIRPVPSHSDGSSQDVVALDQISVPDQTSLPPNGDLMRPKPRANDVVYVMKMSFFGVWLKGRVIEVINSTTEGAPTPNTLYKVKMEIQGTRKVFIKTVPGRHLAYPNPAAVRLNVGTRVIAVFQDEESNNPLKGGSYYSGLIAEPPKINNRYRYLVFFDDGYAQYVPHNKILVVCESSRNVSDDIHPDSREFIQKYLKSYPERPMVKLAPNQVVKTEWNGKWWIARVVQVDGSLVKMSFDADKRTEWIYRGSTRLAPLYTQLANQQARQESGGIGTISRMRGLGMQRINQPYVEYTQNIGAEDDVSEAPVPAPSTVVRAVAKKSTTKKHETTISPIQSTRPSIFNHANVGSVKELQLPKDAPMPKRYQSHVCGPQCIEWIRYDPIKMRGFNPLSIPLYCGWQRELPKSRKKSVIMYTAPCGRRLRNMQELHRYLRICKSSMSVDFFDFDYWVNALSEFTVSEKVKKYIIKQDITHGKENVKIPLVNYVDLSLPNNLIYESDRQAYEGVPLNTDPAFLCGCDCTDDCQNKAKCACWQLTIQGSSLYPGKVADPSVGYYYKRLQERVITGIYECNEQCKCSKKTCLNRVVQHPLQLQLQLFKTSNKGWGLRCINDIPKGTFICIYAGYLYTEQTANLIGEQDGDDYLAELDYIEVVERMKEDYESDVEDDTAEDESTPKRPGRDTETENRKGSSNRYREEPDIDFKVGWRSSYDKNADDTIRSRLRKRTAADLESGDKGSKRSDSSADVKDDSSDDDKLERQPSSFTPKPLKKVTNVGEAPVHRFQSVRKYYGPNECVYIMDANKVGNIGRYLNHSCSPNVFVQNVFVDTHDLRFPWVAFFALSYIRAGTELTWDYNYDVGSVPGKTIICQCGSSECRGRLL